MIEHFEKVAIRDEWTNHPCAFAVCRLTTGGGVYAMHAEYRNGLLHTLCWRIWMN